MELKEIRQEIDKLDRELIELFKARMDCARKVGEYKLKTIFPYSTPKGKTRYSTMSSTPAESTAMPQGSFSPQ